jgi:methyl-accepting chemotaxis protein
MQSQVPQVWSVVFTVVTAFGVLLQALVLLGMYFAIRGAIKKFHQVTDEFKTDLLPTISATRRLVEDLSPKLKIAATNMVEVSQTLRYQTTHVSATVDDVLTKTNAQAARVDEVATAIFNTVEHASATLQQAASIPYRQISGILAGLKAGFDVLKRREKAPRATEVEVPEEVIPS